MRSIRLGSALLLAVGILAAAACGGDDGESGEDTDTTTETITEAADPGSTLIGSVGPGFEISLTTATRQAPGTLQPGAYQLDVDDKSSAHNFHLTGPDGVDVSTDVGGTGAESFQVELGAGTYTFVCDPHSSTMNGTLEVAD